MYNWKFQRLYGNENFNDRLIEDLCAAFIDGMGISTYSKEDIRQRLSHCQLLGVLEGEDGSVYGSIMVSVPETPLDGKYFIWGNGGYLAKAAQKRAVWRQILEKVEACFPEKDFGWIGCRTQNPLMMRSYGLFGKLYPFEGDYGDTEGQMLMDYMLQHVEHVRDVPELFRHKGICKALYREYNIGKLGDYPVNINGQIERQLDRWGFDRDNGDSLVVVAKLPAKDTKSPLSLETYIPVRDSYQELFEKTA